MDRREIHKRLTEDLEKARAQSKAASDAFNEVLKETPSGLPHPDGTQRIRNASVEKAAAHSRLTRAMARMDSFIIAGKIPDDLKEKQ